MTETQTPTPPAPPAPEPEPTGLVAGEIVGTELYSRLMDASSFDAVRQLEPLLLDVDSLTGGGEVVTDKASLIGVEFIVLDWSAQTSSKFGRVDPSTGEYMPGDYTTIIAMTKDNRRVIINDGGTGLRGVLEKHTAKMGRRGGLWARRGLRRSDYTYTAPDGTSSAATTYYFG